MGIIGKVIGGTLGFAVGGPLGAIAGAAFGHAFDSGGEGIIEPQQARLSNGEADQVTFFVAAFSMLARLVHADGAVTRAEMESIEGFMTHELHLSPESQRVAMNIFQAATASPESFRDFAMQFYNQFRSKPELLELMIDILLRVSVADGSLSRSEENLILQAANVFRFSNAQYGRLKSRYIRSAEKYYAVLGCSSTDSDDQIKSQYRKMVRDYHPDTIAAKGLPEDFIKFANSKFQEIHQAYEMIKQERGMH